MLFWLIVLLFKRLITAINSKINNKKKVQNFNYVNTPDEDQDYQCLTLLSTIQSNLSMQSPVYKGHLFLFCNRRFHMKCTSFKRSPVLSDHFFFVPRWPLNTGLTISFLAWWLNLKIEESGVPKDKHTYLLHITVTLYNTRLYVEHLNMRGSGCIVAVKLTWGGVGV